jgi:uncharacterized LabA/DUF88 family protein
MLMNQAEIRRFLEAFKTRVERTIVIVDFGNVEKWKHSLNWRVGIQELANLVKNFSKGQKFLRRFYYGSDYGPKESHTELDPWSKGVLERADMNGLHVVTKRVKYIRSADNVHGFEKKCDMDVEMTVDLIRERENYDNIVLFSGDGDLMYALRFLHAEYGKEAMVFGARDHTGREVFDALKDGVIGHLFFAEDFEYRLDMDRGRRR